MGNFQSRTRRASQSANNAAFTNIAAEANTVAVGVPVADAVLPDGGSMALSVSAERMALSVSAERSALASNEEHSVLAMLSIKAPPALDDVSRPPMDLVACIDRSGSMRGEKMDLMKRTLELLVKRSGLKKDDRVSLVSFDSSVKLELGLTAMDTEGRTRAEAIVKRLHPGATTNLSGGALRAIDVFQQDGANNKGKNESRTRAVMLFTDGLANEGIRDPTALQGAVAGALAAASTQVGGPISLFTFGFGADHQEELLRNLATNSGASGMYYYVASAEDIPNAFADCLGGLTSVVAQNATLSLEALGHGVAVKRVLGNTYTRDASGSIALGDLFAEDEKDVLVELSLPKLASPVDDAAPVLKATLSGFNVPRATPEAVEALLGIARPASTPASQPVNTALDAQRNRIRMAEEMEAASRMADAGDVAGGRARLQAMRAMAQASASCETSLVSALVSQCAELEEVYESETRYRSVGSKMSKMQVMSHSRQRATHANVGSYAAGAKRKAALKASWMSSMGGGNGSDSD